MSHERFAEKSLGDELRNPVLIVGQNPGKQRRGEQTKVVWEGNRSADLLLWVLDGQTNVYLTNVCNYQEMTPDRVAEGMRDLLYLIEQLQPDKIVCLGAFAHLAVRTFDQPFPIYKMLHPSYIVRFQKDRDEYKARFLNKVFHV